MLARSAFAAVGCAALVALASLPAGATSPVQFGRIQYNAPGTDGTANSRVNGEYVVIRALG